MLNFDFCNPTRIVFGEGRIKEISSLIPANACVLVLYGGGSAEKNGTLAQVRKALGQRDFAEFGGIEANPTYETLMRAVDQVHAEKRDFLLAVGGGSVIDGVKFVAAAAEFKDEPWDILRSYGMKVKSALPFGTVLTLPATGSEMNNGAVITRKSQKAKMAFMTEHVFPVFSVLDPTLTYTLPQKQISNGIVDAFVHIVEQYLTYPVGGHVQDRLAEGLLLSLIEVGPQTLAKPQDYELRSSFMWAATLALNGLIGAGVPGDWSTHLIGHELTALHGLDHAQTLAVVLPAMLNERRIPKRAKLLQYGARVWGITDGDEDSRIDLTIAATRSFFELVGVKTWLNDYDIGKEAVDAIITQLPQHAGNAMGESLDVTPEIARRVLLACLK